MEHLDVIGLLKAVQVMERNMNVALMYSGLRIPQFRLLDLLEQAGQATVTEMSGKLRVTRATASVTINELIKLGAIEAVENFSDRRSFHIRLTDSGHQRLSAARSDLGVYCAKVSQRYAPEVIQVLNAFSNGEGPVS